MERMLELDQQVLYRILDVRGEAEFEAGHVQGALNIAHTGLLAGAEEMTKDGRWLVHCRSGSRAAAACAVLQRLGYQVTHVDGEFPGIRPRTQNPEPT